MSIENSQETYLFQASLTELKQGFIETAAGYRCIICGAFFEKGEIYPLDGHYYDAKRMASVHLEQEHKGMLSYLLARNHDFLGLSELQLSLLRLMASGSSDKEIAAQKGISPSTLRNHRYKFREKAKQARLFLATFDLLSAQDQNGKPDTASPDPFLHAHPSATMLDDRYQITEAERKKIIRTYFDETGALRECPSKEKKKLVVLNVIAANFHRKKRYTEAEVNRILKRIYSDFPYLRRLLIEYGFLERTVSGDSYWVKE